MAVIDVEALLTEVSADAPSGPDLEYEPPFEELERLAQGKPERQIGDSVLPAEEPDWRELKGAARDLLAQTKDLRIAIHLTNALVRTDGFVGLSEGLALIKGLIERYWESVHPQLDPEDNDDPTMRINSLVALCDAEGLLRGVREAPVVSSRVLGRYNLRDLLIANGKLTPKAGEALPELNTVEAAFKESDPESVQANAEAVEQALDHVQAIENRVTEKVGAAHGLDLSPLINLLRELQQFLAPRAPQRNPEEPISKPDEGAATEAVRATGSMTAQPTGGEVTSREEVVRLLDALCHYYERHEPSSPIPLLLQRAKRLVYKDFIEVVRDLAPDGLPQAERIRGSSDDASSE